MHVRQTIREDHQARIATHDEEAREEFDVLAGSLFRFFRGTALLFHRDMAGADAWMPSVLAAGDAHPENIGVVPDRDDVPVFGIDDYDEAAHAPFTWALERAATGFVVAAASEGGKGASEQRSIAEALVRGYAEAVAAYAVDATEAADEVRRDNAPPIIADLLDHAVRRSRAEYLTRKSLDETGAGFAPSEKIVPVSSRREEFQELVDRYTTTGHEARIAHAQRVVMASSGAFYGSVEHDGTSSIVRERSWNRDDVELADLSSAQWHDYARVCGQVLAQAHAMSDEAGRVGHDVEPAITEAMSPLDPVTDRRAARAPGPP